MAIRFACPSCQQPIEVDDPLGGQSVACPYCRNVVTAPPTSVWSQGEIPLASPVSPAFAPPLPPAGSAPAPAPAPGSTGALAPWALTLALMSAGLCGFGTIAWMGHLAVALESKTGPNATHEEVQKALQEEMLSGRVRMLSPTSTMLFGVGLICGVAGLVFSIQSLVRQENRRAMAIVACVISLCFAACQVMPMLAALAATQMKPPS